MNLWDTWTSRAVWTGTSWSLISPIPGVGTSSQVSLRSVQKTCGLFNTELAGNNFVASQAVKPGTESGAMETFVATATDEGSLGGILQDLPVDLTEADYLDSFMDLSNFLIPENGTKVEEDVCVGNVEMKEKVVDFSGIIPLLSAETPVIHVEEIVPTSNTSSMKRSYADTFDDVIDTCAVSTLELSEVPVYDHDYVAKKMKLDTVPKPSTSKMHTESASRSNNKYRERRDKNNAASKRSREIRKQKYAEMGKEADMLEIKNEALRKKIVELEQLAKFMKAELIKKMTQK